MVLTKRHADEYDWNYQFICTNKHLHLISLWHPIYIIVNYVETNISVEIHFNLQLHNTLKIISFAYVGWNRTKICVKARIIFIKYYLIKETSKHFLIKTLLMQTIKWVSRRDHESTCRSLSQIIDINIMMFPISKMYLI